MTDEESPPSAPIGFTTTTSWERVGREVVAGELFESRGGVRDEFHDIETALRSGEEIDADQIRDARMALNRAYRILEHYVATTTDGVEPWELPPDIPMGRFREPTNHPKADGVDPREYFSEEGDDE